MEGKFILEQFWSWRHKDNEGDSLRCFPKPEISEEVEIEEILNHGPNVSLDDVEWLLLMSDQGKFRLFVRGYQDPGDYLEIGNKVKKRYLDLLRYELPDIPEAIETVWPLEWIKDLDSMSSWYQSRWQSLAVLAILTGNKLQVLRPEPYSEADVCAAYCSPPEDKDIDLCKYYNCI